MNIELLTEALAIWQEGPRLDKEDYHSSTGFLSNSMIGDFLSCEYNAVIEYAIKEKQPFNQVFAIGHLVEAEIFEGEEGRKEMLVRYKDNAFTDPTQAAIKLYEDRVILCSLLNADAMDEPRLMPNGKKPTKPQLEKFERIRKEYGEKFPEYPKPIEKSWVKDATALAQSVTRHKKLVDLFRSEGSIYHQAMVFDLLGMKWRGEIDYLNLNKNTEIDCKTTASDFRDKSWNDLTRCKDLTFIDSWDYHRQRAVYQFGINQLYDQMVQPRILAISKKTKSVRIFKFDDQDRLDNEIKKLVPIVDRIKEVLAGEDKPTQCEVCPRCVDAEDVNKEILTSTFCAGWL